MKGFWQLISAMISLTAFVVIGGLLLLKGEPIDQVGLRAVAAAFVLWIVLGTLGKILSFTASAGRPDETLDE